MLAILTILTTLTAIVVGIPLDHEGLELIDFSHQDLGQLARLLMSPHLEDSSLDNGSVLDQIKETPSHVSDKLVSGAIHASHFVESQKDAVIGAAVLPFKVGLKSAAVGGAIPAISAIKGSVIGSAMATPVIVKAVALPGVTAGKSLLLFRRMFSS